MRYVFKPREEALWFVMVAVAAAVLQALVDLDPSAVTDWKAWLISVGVAAVRAGAGAGLAMLTRPVTARAEEADATVE